MESWRWVLPLLLLGSFVFNVVFPVVVVVLLVKILGRLDAIAARLEGPRSPDAT